MDDEDNESDYGVEFSDNDEMEDDDIDNDNQFEAGEGKISYTGCFMRGEKKLQFILTF